MTLSINSNYKNIYNLNIKALHSNIMLSFYIMWHIRNFEFSFTHEDSEILNLIIDSEKISSSSSLDYWLDLLNLIDISIFNKWYNKLVILKDYHAQISYIQYLEKII